MKNSFFCSLIFACSVLFAEVQFGSQALFAQDAQSSDIVIRKNNSSESATIFQYLPAGTKGKVVASNFEQIIAFDGTIRFPLSDMTCSVSVGDNDKNAKTFTVKFVAEKAAGTKPFVVPAIQEWAGVPGEFVLDGEVLVWCDSRDIKRAPELKKYAKNFVRDLRSLTGLKIKTVGKKPNSGKFIALSIGGDARLGKEGYTLSVKPESIELRGVEAIGVNWGAQTLLQVFKGAFDSNKKFAFPCGDAVDYPQYPVRGFMYDVARKPASIHAVRNVARTMAYYKMNDLQLHLNDNFIWLHDYTKIPNGKDASAADKKAAIDEVLAAAPTGFRLESNVPGLTSTDYAYSKHDFSELQEDAASYGVTIVPEIDIPGHAMSFVKVRPDLMYRGVVHKPHDVERAAMLDASADIFDEKTGRTYRDETLKFVQSVMDEYMLPGAKNKKVFRDKIVHIGTDEYYGNAEDYRAFADAMLKYVKSRGYTPRLWGSLRAKQGKTPVVSDGVQMHIWSLGWQDPKSAIDMGYDIINILDGHTYIVPNGTGNVGAYCDYINLENLYRPSWNPNVMGGQRVLAGHPKLLGAQFAVWNDNSWRRDTGLTDYDLYERIRESCAVMAEKTWAAGTDCSYADFMALSDKIGVPPGTNPLYELKNSDIAGTKTYKDAKCKNAEIDEEKSPVKVSLKGGKSFVELRDDNSFAPNYKITLSVKRILPKNGKKQDEEILFSSPAGTFKASQKGTGKVGFTRDAWDFSFDYTLPFDKTVELTIVAKGRSTTLYVDGVKIGGPVRAEFPESHRFSTFIFPLKRIGDSVAAFCGDVVIKSVEVIKPRSLDDCVKIASAKTSSEQNSNPDGGISNAIDGNTKTYWHSRYSPKKDSAPFSVDIELGDAKEINGVSFLPRQDGQNNGTPEAGEIYVRENGAWKKVADFESAASDRNLNSVNFQTKKTDAVRFVITKGAGGFGALAELYVHGAKK